MYLWLLLLTAITAVFGRDIRNIHNKRRTVISTSESDSYYSNSNGQNYEQMSFTTDNTLVPFEWPDNSQISSDSIKKDQSLAFDMGNLSEINENNHDKEIKYVESINYSDRGGQDPGTDNSSYRNMEGYPDRQTSSIYKEQKYNTYDNSNNFNENKYKEKDLFFMIFNNDKPKINNVSSKRGSEVNNFNWDNLNAYNPSEDIGNNLLNNGNIFPGHYEKADFSLLTQTTTDDPHFRSNNNQNSYNFQSRTTSRADRHQNKYDDDTDSVYYNQKPTVYYPAATTPRPYNNEEQPVYPVWDTNAQNVKVGEEWVWGIEDPVSTTTEITFGERYAFDGDLCPEERKRIMGMCVETD